MVYGVELVVCAGPAGEGCEGEGFVVGADDDVALGTEEAGEGESRGLRCARDEDCHAVGWHGMAAEEGHAVVGGRSWWAESRRCVCGTGGEEKTKECNT